MSASQLPPVLLISLRHDTSTRPLATLTTMLDPDCIVVDASLEAAAAPFIAGLTEELTRRSSAALMSRVSILQGTLPNAIALGAIAAADAVTQSAVTGAPLPFTPATPGAAKTPAVTTRL